MPKPDLRSARLRVIGDRARELAKLVEHPSWPALRDVFEERRQAYLTKLAREIAAGGEDAPPLDERKIAYRRGFLRGAQAVLDAPENALALLERELAKEDEGV